MIAFHRFLISAAIVFCVVLGIWLFGSYRSGGGIAALILAFAFGAAAVLLGYYLRHLNRFLGRHR